MRTEDVIEARLKKIKNLYFKVDELLDDLPDNIPEKYRDIIRNAIFGDSELKEIMKGIDHNRPPRLMMFGRTGVGKSSLINAICGRYVAEVSDVEIGTKNVQRCEHRCEGRTLFEVLDTRGIGESFLNEVKDDNDAEKAVIESMTDFKPDAILFVMRCKARDRINEDIHVLKSLTKKYYKINNIEVPVIAILNQADELEPSQYKNPNDFPGRKIDNIEKAINHIKEIFIEEKLRVHDIIAVSSLIDWGLDEDEIKKMKPSERDVLQMEGDFRYNIEKLVTILEKAIDVEAKMGLLMAARLERVVERLSKRIINAFAAASAVVAATPIPLSDIYILTSLQALLLVFIAALSGRDINIKSAKEILLSFAGIGAGGLVFRTAAQQASKVINVIIPTAGSAVSSAIAFGGTKAVGKAAVDYFIRNKDINRIKEKLKGNEYQEA